MIMDKELRQTLIQWVGAREARWVLHYRYPTAELKPLTTRACG